MTRQTAASVNGTNTTTVVREAHTEISAGSGKLAVVDEPPLSPNRWLMQL